MTSLRNSIAALAVSLPLVAAAQQPAAAEPAPAAPPAAAPAPAPAAAPAKAPLATLYGTLNVNAQTTMSKGATKKGDVIKSRGAVSVDSSNIGVRGAADVAHGYQLVYQCETSANLDAGGQTLCNRNSRIGLSAFWGTLFFGNWDTPYKAAFYGTKADDPFGNTDVFGYNAIFGSPGFNTQTGTWTGTTAATAGVTGFDLRANNSISYWSPKFMGASLKALFATDEGKNALGTVDPILASIAVNYDFAGFSVAAAFERHEDGFGIDPLGAVTINRSTKDDAWKIGAGYELGHPFGTTTVNAGYEMLKYTMDNAPTDEFTEVSRGAWQVGLKHRIGNHEVRARYSMADSGDCKLKGGAKCDPKDLGATDLALGYAYHFTKAAQGYAYYTRIDNEKLAQYTFTTGGSSVISGKTQAGANPTAAGVGLRYAF